MVGCWGKESRRRGLLFPSFSETERVGDYSTPVIQQRRGRLSSGGDGDSRALMRAVAGENTPLTFQPTALTDTPSESITHLIAL